jgi:hypothetical protein
MGLCWKADCHDANSICGQRLTFLIEFSVANGASLLKVRLLICCFEQGSKNSWKSGSQINILVTTERWIRIFWCLPQPVAFSWLAGLISSCYIACSKHVQARHKIIPIKLNLKVRLIVMTYAFALIFTSLPVVWHFLCAVSEQVRLPELQRPILKYEIRKLIGNFFVITGDQTTSFLDHSLWKNYFEISSFDIHKSVWSSSDAAVTFSIYVCFFVLGDRRFFHWKNVLMLKSYVEKHFKKTRSDHKITIQAMKKYLITACYCTFVFMILV